MGITKLASHYQGQSNKKEIETKLMTICWILWAIYKGKAAASNSLFAIVN
jgi:hypothetical protein